ncbi:MAG TPA: carboxypeptidase regulatory-like domain-containing protein [Vicinamibacterales bacterium]|jgi:hypothetical protein|nr:carboxypeptidase regulatory-like domain-containing protein [Vicinamibacterales bacterium]
MPYGRVRVRSRSRTRASRAIALVSAGAAAFALTCLVPLDAAQSPPACHVSGHATSDGKPLPGVAIVATATNAAGGGAPLATSTDTDGSYRLALVPGTFTLSIQLTGFTPLNRDITLSGTPCDQGLDITLRLAPRDQQWAASQRTVHAASAAAHTHAPSTTASSAGAPPNATAANGNTPSRFQRLEVQSSTTSPEVADASASTDREADAATRLLLPPGFSVDAPTEAVAINGNAASLDRGLMNDRLAALGRGEFDPLTGQVAPGFAPQGAGGPGGVPGGRGRGGPGGQGGRGGPGGFFIGGRGGRQNTFNATASYSFGGSALDAAPYQLHPDSPTPKQPYTKQNFGFTVGGPVKIPHLYDGARKTFFIASYTGNRGDTLFDQFATVPTAALRAGNFAGTSTRIIDPSTGLPFPGNQIPADRVSTASTTLLQYIPQPDTDALHNNFHYTTTTGSALDNVNVRVIQNFTPGAQNGRGGFGGFGGGRGGGRFGGGGGQGRQGTNVILTAQMQYRRTQSDQANVFPSLAGTSSGWSLGLPVTLNVAHHRTLHNINVNFSETHSASSNQYAFVQNIAGDAGIAGVSTDPFDWGLPTLSFANFSSARDVSPSIRTDRRISTAYTWTHPVRAHTLRAGGDFRFDRSTSEADPNPRGTFVFTGLYTGGGVNGSTGSDLDFADFLLGLPQQASVQYGPGQESVDGRSMSLFVQDDWRKSAGLTFSLGLRYELLWPFTETHGQLVNLDVAPDFTAAVPVVSGGTGPFTGPFPVGLIQTDTNNLAPRLGVAWRIKPGMVLRGGYGISYNSGTYSTIARQMASQPPFAVTSTTIGTVPAPLSIVDPFGAVPESTTTNNYGVARDYDLGRVQTWNADLSKDLSPVWNVGVDYTEIRGANLDIVRAPNRGPTGLRIPDVQAFLWQTSEGASVLHAGTFRLQKRQSHGIGGNLTYTLGRSRDDASTVGGGATVVAQNDQDLAAEWGPSSFNRRNQLTGAVSVELPFGPNRRWLNAAGGWAALLGNWRLSANYSWLSGTPLTPLVRASAADAARGTSGTLRANYDGGSIALPNPTIAEFFNTSVFAIPSPGTFGTAGRNIITGPGSQQLNAQLARDMHYGGSHVVTLDVSATNLLNTVNFAAIDTYVNSPTFGQVVSVRPLRSMQLSARFRF